MKHLALLLLTACAGADRSPRATTQLPPAPRGPYLGEAASDRPKMFGRDFVSTPHQDLNAAFSPDGDELFFTLADPGRSHYTLLHMIRAADGTWSRPQVAPFSGRYADADPIFTHDGKRLYFISRRPITADPTPKKDFDIWFVQRAATGWGVPVAVGPPVNTPDDEFYVSVTRGGTLYWGRKGDIHRASPEGSSYRVETLGAEVNGAPGTTREGDPFVAPDESYLIFASSDRPDGLGAGDLYVSFNASGAWQPARWLGPLINSRYNEYCPIVSPDGKYFFFTSYRKPEVIPPPSQTLEEIVAGFVGIENGLGNVYWMSTQFLDTMRAGGPPPI